MPLDPTDRPALQFSRLVRVLADHDIRWVLCGSQVLALHGAKLAPNDLDVVPDLDPDNLVRVAACLKALDAIPALLGGKNIPLEACHAWRPDPPTAENLDHLLVTSLGMLDIVIKNADPYASLLDGATPMSADGTPYLACDPRRVLKALEGRNRKKDQARRPAYEAMRRRFGMTDLEG